MSWEVRTMQFGTSYFNKTLFAKHFARFWPIWGLYGLIWTMCLPLGILLDSRSGWTQVRARVLPLNYLDTSGWFSAATFLAVVFGLLAAMAVFSYLYSARSVGLFHALPLRREGLFLTSYLAGLGFLILPNLAVFLLALAAEAACGAVVFSSLFTWLVVSSLLNLFFYSFAVFCAMFTGHILALPSTWCSTAWPPGWPSCSARWPMSSSSASTGRPGSPPSPPGSPLCSGCPPAMWSTPPSPTPPATA